jgi:hypothetical protein
MQGNTGNIKTITSSQGVKEKKYYAPAETLRYFYVQSPVITALVLTQEQLTLQNITTRDAMARWPV